MTHLPRLQFVQQERSSYSLEWSKFKPVKDPSLDEFYSLIEKAQKTAAQLGLTEEDINAEIKAMRADKRK